MVAQVLDEIGRERLRPLRRGEYDRLVALGCFADERLELLRGVLVAMSPQGALHAEVIRRLTRLLIVALGDTAVVQGQSPLALDDSSEPEPDVAVVPPGDYAEEHPARALLVIEVADSSLRKDRLVKGGLYAEAGIPEFWLVDLDARVVEVYRDPVDGRYTSASRVGREVVIRPVALPGLGLAVADFLPQPR
ncbi:MAG TPA: Uma2 family endonuclease [Polyangia bacterium]|jgi:Uma2 family endonuclease